MARADIHLRAARETADWLEQQGEAKRANDVRAVCRSLSTARTTMSALHHDNMELRRRAEFLPRDMHREPKPDSR